MATIESAFTVSSSNCRFGASTGAVSTTGAGGGAGLAAGLATGGPDDDAAAGEGADDVGETSGVSITGSSAGCEAGRVAVRGGSTLVAGFFFSDAAFAFGDGAGVDARAFGCIALLNTVSGAGDAAGAGDAGDAAADSDLSAGDDSGDGVASGVGSAAATGAGSVVATGAGLALRRATTKPADATDTTMAATAAVMKRDPVDI